MKRELATLGRLMRYLFPRNRRDLQIRVGIAMGSLVGAKVLGVYTPFLYKSAIDRLSSNAQLIAVPVGLVVAYGIARLSAQILGEVRDMVFAKVAQHAVRELSLRTFSHLHALSLQFHLDRQTGGIARIMERGGAGFQFIVTFMLFNIIPTFIEISLVTLILANRYPPAFAGITLATIIAYIFFTVVVTEKRKIHRRRMNTADNIANTKAVDSLLNYETVKYFGNEAHELAMYDAALIQYQRAAVQNQLSLGFLNCGQAVIISIGLVAVMMAAANGVVFSRLTVGDFVLVNTFLIQLYQPLNYLGFVYREIRRALVDMEQMMELWTVVPAVVDVPNAPPLVISAGSVRLVDVTFSYDSRRPVLANLTIDMPAGTTTAIVGASGAGKSTISRLLYRFYDIQSGRIEIDGVDIRAVTQASLRSVIGIVPQDTVLFNDTLGTNIRYGRPSASDAELQMAIEMAMIADFIATLPDGLDTVVGERGLKLSGGERQRVAIARTILKNPKILIFDEATSALDSHTEREIQSALEQLSTNRTTIIIAHRLSTIIHADTILVLENGSVVESGTHRELLNRSGKYAMLWNRQQELAALGEDATPHIQ